jgi:predicted DNA-binding transcriptional regulator AlpA
MSLHRKSATPSGMDASPEAPDPFETETWRIAYRLAELAAALGLSRRTIERERSAGRFPPPDLTIGKMPLWKPETIRAWVEKGGKA